MLLLAELSTARRFIFCFQRKNQIDIKEHLNNNTWYIFTKFEKIYAEFIANKSVSIYGCPTKKSWKLQNWNEKSIYQYAF